MTLGTLMVFINQSIVLISLPDIFRGIQLNPLTPGNTGYLLWMLMGFTVVLAVLVVTLGRVGDIFGRVKIFNLGFIIFTAFSILLAVTWLTGTPAAIWLITMRIGQGRRRRHALRQLLGHHHRRLPRRPAWTRSGHQQHGRHRRLVRRAGPRRSAGAGRVAPRLPDLGALRDPRHPRRLRRSSRSAGRAHRPRSTGSGNITFAAGLILVLVGITYGLLPYGGHSMGWTNPKVLAEIIGGVLSSSSSGSWRPG